MSGEKEADKLWTPIGLSFFSYYYFLQIISILNKWMENIFAWRQIGYKQNMMGSKGRKVLECCCNFESMVLYELCSSFSNGEYILIRSFFSYIMFDYSFLIIMVNINWSGWSFSDSTVVIHIHKDYNWWWSESWGFWGCSLHSCML